jgi:hypothetical protein
MRSLRHPLSALCLLAALSATMATARADDDRGRGRDRDRGPERTDRQQDAERMSRQRRQDALSDAVRRIERSNRGQVLSAERMQSDGRDINRIKVVDDRGRVRIYTDDPQQQQQQRRGPPPPPTRRDDD